MYDVEEFYSVDGQDLKELLKSCVFNYYVKNKENPVDELPKQDKNRIIDMTNKKEILSRKGVKNVQTVQ